MITDSLRQYVKSKSGETIGVRNPNDDSLVVSDVQVAGPEDVDAAVKAASDAFKGEWSKFTGTQRATCMLKFADLLDQNVEKLAKLETVAMGQPIGVAMVSSLPRSRLPFLHFPCLYIICFEITCL